MADLSEVSSAEPEVVLTNGNNHKEPVNFSNGIEATNGDHFHSNRFPSVASDGFSNGMNGDGPKLSNGHTNGTNGVPKSPTPSEAEMPIAIIGMSCRFPGDSTNPSKLWDLLSKGKAAWSEIPPEKFNLDAFYHPDPNRNGAVSFI